MSRPVHADESETKKYVCMQCLVTTYERDTKAHAYRVTLAGQRVNEAGSRQKPCPSFKPTPMLDQWSQEDTKGEMPINEFLVQQGVL